MRVWHAAHGWRAAITGAATVRLRRTTKDGAGGRQARIWGDSGTCAYHVAALVSGLLHLPGAELSVNLTMKRYNDAAFALGSLADHMREKGATKFEQDCHQVLRRVVAILEDHAVEDEKQKLRIADLERQLQKLRRDVTG